MQEFLTEAEERMATLDQDILLFEKAGPDADVLPRIFRAAHNIKGSCGFLKLMRLGALAHAVEDVLSRCRDHKIHTTPQMSDLLLAAFDQMRLLLATIGATGSEPAGDDAALIAVLGLAAGGQSFSLPDTYNRRSAGHEKPSASLRVHVDVLENLMALTGELVLARNQLLAQSSAETLPLQRLNTLVSGLQAEVLRARMQPVMQAWRPLPRLLRDTVRVTGKPIGLEMAGAETALDRHVLDTIRDPLAHLVRNAAVHGVEEAQARCAAGKPAEAVIRLSAHTAEGYVLVSVIDDGRGLDAAHIGDMAVARGLVTPAKLAEMCADDIIRFILQPGFSTAADVTTEAGRGVGLDAVRSAVEKIGGTIQISSKLGQGSCFTLRLPLTLAIVPAIIAQAGGRFYAVPQTAVQELVQCDRQDIEYMDGQPVMHLRGHLVPLYPLVDILPSVAVEKKIVEKKYQQAVILRGEGIALGLLVDAIQSAEDVVVKPLPHGLSDITGLLGCAILGGGDVAMILDINRLVQHVVPAHDLPLRPEAAPVVEERVDALLFRHTAAGAIQAVDIAAVVRVCDLSRCDVVQDSAGKYFLPQGDELIPFAAEGACPEQAKIGILLRYRDHVVALAALDVLDILALAPPSAVAPHQMLKGEMVEWVNVQKLCNVPNQEISADQGPRRILLVDDSAFFCNLLLPVLHGAGYAVVTAANVDAALSLYSAGQVFSAIISDIEMPGMSGFDLAKRIKVQGGRWQHLPLLALSAHSTRHDDMRARAAGFDVLINKFDRDSLLRHLAKNIQVAS